MDYKNVLLIVFQDIMRVGGIENTVYNTIKDTLSFGGTVILNMKKGCVIDKEYGDIIDNPAISITHGILTPKKVKNTIKDRPIDTIKILSYTAFNFCLSDILKSRLSGRFHVDTFFCIPHFVGSSIYLEEGFPEKSRECVKNRYGIIIRKLNDNDCIRYFSRKHIDAMTSRYKYTLLEDGIERYIPVVKRKERVFDEKRVKKLWHRERFNILTISRLEFPHKGYIIGLIDAYEEIKQKYHNITLTICGYGVSQNELVNRISKLNEKIRKDVILVGKTAPTKLVDLYNDANLNISVAGCYSQGVANGTLSMPARHYSYKCEVYGLSPEANKYSLNEDPGYPVIPFIEKVINMSEEEYIALSEASYKSFAEKELHSSRFLCNACNFNNKSVLKWTDVLFLFQNEFRFHILYHLKHVCEKFHI